MGLLDGALKRFGLTEESAKGLLGVVVTEGRAIAGDALGAIVQNKVGETIVPMIRPLLLEMRNELLANIVDVPPAGFAERLRARGYTEISDAQVQQLWSDMIASLAEQPAPATTAA